MLSQFLLAYSCKEYNSTTTEPAVCFHVINGDVPKNYENPWYLTFPQSSLHLLSCKRTLSHRDIFAITSQDFQRPICNEKVHTIDIEKHKDCPKASINFFHPNGIDFTVSFMSYHL